MKRITASASDWKAIINSMSPDDEHGDLALTLNFSEFVPDGHMVSLSFLAPEVAYIKERAKACSLVIGVAV